MLREQPDKITLVARLNVIFDRNALERDGLRG
jgi:hypothetical protein